MRDETVAMEEAAAVNPNTAREQGLRLDENPAGTAVQPAQPTSIWGIFRVLLTLALVAVAIYGLVYFIKRFARGNKDQDPFLKVLAGTSLGANRSVHIISVGSRAWLVGSAEHGVNLISEIDEKETLDALLIEDSRKSAEASPSGKFPDFKAMLNRLGVPSDSGAPAGPENIRKRRERLKGL